MRVDGVRPSGRSPSPLSARTTADAAVRSSPLPPGEGKMRGLTAPNPRPISRQPLDPERLAHPTTPSNPPQSSPPLSFPCPVAREGVLGPGPGRAAGRDRAGAPPRGTGLHPGAAMAVPAEGRPEIEAAVPAVEKQGVRRAWNPPPVAGRVTPGDKRRKAQGTEDPRQAVRPPPRHARANRSRRSLGESRKHTPVPVTRKQGATHRFRADAPGSADFPPPRRFRSVRAPPHALPSLSRRERA